MIAKGKDAVTPPDINQFLSCDEIVLSYPVNYNSLTNPQKTALKRTIKATKKWINKFNVELLNLAKKEVPSTNTNQGVPAHQPSVAIWKEISKLTTSTGTAPVNYHDPFPSGTVYATDNLPVYGGLKIKSIGPTPKLKVLDVPPDMHQGLLLDYAQLLALHYVEQQLLNDLTKKMSLNIGLKRITTLPINNKLVTDYIDPSNSSSFSSCGRYLIAYLDYLGYKPAGKKKNYGGKNPSDQAEHQAALATILFPNSIFIDASGGGAPGEEDKRTIQLRKYGFQELWKLQNRGDEMPNEKLLDVSKGFSIAKNNLVQFYAQCLYKTLGGTQEGIQSLSMATGDGSGSVGLLNDYARALALFNYDFDINRILNHPKVVPLVERTQGLEFAEGTGCTGGVPSLHFNVFARDRDDFSTSVPDHDIFRISIAAEGVNGNFRLRELEFGMTPEDGTEFWIEAGTTNLVGRFSPITNDLKIFRSGLRKFNVTLRSGSLRRETLLDTGGPLEAGAAEILLSASAYCAKQPELFVNLERLFKSDRFEIQSADITANIWPDLSVLDDFIAKLGATDSANITSNLQGGFIGRLVVPFEVSLARINSTFTGTQDQRYKIGTAMIFNNRMYVARVNDAGDPNNPTTLASDWVLGTISGVNGIGINTFSYRTLSHITDSSNVIWRINANQQNTTITTFNPTQWTQVAVFFDILEEYDKDARVLYNGEYYQALEKVGKGNFNPNQWQRIPKVESDPAYTIPDTSSPGSPTQEHFSGVTALNRSTYVSLRYSFADITADENGVNFNIRSFASPLTSRLDQKIFGSNPTAVHTVTDLNAHTNPNYSVNSNRSYNEILTHLRCFGILEALICRIKLRLSQYTSAPATFITSVNNKLDALLDGAVINTIPQFVTTGSPPFALTGNQMLLKNQSQVGDDPAVTHYYQSFKNYTPGTNGFPISSVGNC